MQHIYIPSRYGTEDLRALEFTEEQVNQLLEQRDSIELSSTDTMIVGPNDVPHDVVTKCCSIFF